MSKCTYCGWPGAPKPGVMCSACVDRFQKETAPPPLSEEAAKKFEEVFSQPSERMAVIVDDLEADCPVEPGHREKVLANYDEIIGAFRLPKDSIILEGPAAAPVTNAVLSLFQCGPGISPCGPSCDDHTWDDEEAVYDAAGNECGATAKCSKCGLTARDFDLWNSP